MIMKIMAKAFSYENAPWVVWPGDDRKSPQEIFKDRLMFGDFDNARLIRDALLDHEVKRIGAKQYYKFLRDEPLRAAGVAQVCGMKALETDAANEWYDNTVEKDGGLNVRRGTTKIAHIFSVSHGRLESAAIKESRDQFTNGNWFYAVDLLKMVGMDPKSVLRSLGQDGFDRAVRERNKLMARFIADEVLGLSGAIIDIPETGMD